MAKKAPAVHTVPNPDGGWDNKQGGKVVSHHDKKAPAVAAGKDEAKKDKTDAVVHNKDGKIAGGTSYGNDPCPPKDKD
jgi:hypothetical protein